MEAESRQVTMDDVLLLLGRSTVELAFLRARVMELERQLGTAPNGLARTPMDQERAEPR